MVAGCANCGAEFLHASLGRLFQFSTDAPTKSHGEFSGVSQGASAPGAIFYWLCENCAAKFTLRLTADRKPHIIPVADIPTDEAVKQELDRDERPVECPNCSTLARAD